MKIGLIERDFIAGSILIINNLENSCELKI
jgi:hypothetical protein